MKKNKVNSALSPPCFYTSYSTLPFKGTTENTYVSVPYFLSVVTSHTVPCWAIHHMLPNYGYLLKGNRILFNFFFYYYFSIVSEIMRTLSVISNVYCYIMLIFTISPEDIIRPVGSSSTMPWFIRYIYYWNLQFLNNVIINKTKVLLPRA